MAADRDENLVDSNERSGWEILTSDADRNRLNVRAVMDTVRDLSPGHEDLDVFVPRVLARVIEVARAERALVVVLKSENELVPRWGLDQDGKELGRETPISISVCRSVIRERQLAVSTDATPSTVDSTSASIFDLELQSILAAPLIGAGGDILGVLYADSRKSLHTFGTPDEYVFQALAMILTMALEREAGTRAREESARIRQDLEEARAIQGRLQPSTLAQAPGLDIASFARPCEETSGDYYDAIPLTDGRIVAVAGDVSDHGLGPCLYALQARTRLRTDIDRGFLDPKRLLTDLNLFLQDAMSESEFMSLCLAIIDPSKQAVQFASAGHPPALLWAPGTDRVTEVTPTGPVLGLFAQAMYGLTDPYPFSSGAYLLLYTDGMFEAMNPDGELWGEERMQASFLRHAQQGGTARAVLDGLADDLAAHHKQAPLADDVTAIVVRAK